MNPACQAFRETLHDPRGSREAHASECRDCAAYAARLERSAGALAELERHAAPAELDGRVVAALQAGAREDRAVRALGGLAHLRVPEPVDEALAAQAEFKARHPEAELEPLRLHPPHVLERLVAEELADPAAARVRRFVSSLPRFEAPEGLEARLARSLTGAPGSAGSDGAARWRFPRRVSGKALALTAAALVLLTLLGPLRPAEEPPRRHLRLQAASLGDLESFSPFASGLVGGLGGGLVAREQERR